MHRRFAKFTVCISGKPFGIKKLLSGFTKETVQMKKWGKKSIIFVLDVVIIVIVLWLFVSWNEKGRCYQKDCIIGPDGADSQFKKYTRMHLCFRDRSITFYTDMMGLHAFSHISTQRLGTQRKCLCLFSAAHTDRLFCLLFLSLLRFITFLKLGFVSKCLSNFCD